MSYYPDDISGPMICRIEGCAGPNCSRCGTVNYQWLGFTGFLSRMAKQWGCTREQAEERWLDGRHPELVGQP